MKDLKSLLDLMFLSNETICASDSKWAYHSFPISSVLSGEVILVSPNSKVAIKTVKSEELTLLTINPISGYRNDNNVIAYRNFLFEIDVGSLFSQIKYIKTLKLPTSAAIFSGNKSIHFLVSLDQDLDKKTYKSMYEWALNIATFCDQNCRNPSRNIRIPGVLRPDTGNKQRLIELNGKVKLDNFLNWLNEYPHLKPKEREERKNLTNDKDYKKLSSWAKYQLKNGIDFSNGRNKTWFSLACDLYKSGCSEEEAVYILNNHFTEESDFKEKEFLTAINSAFKYMSNKN